MDKPGIIGIVFSLVFFSSMSLFAQEPPLTEAEQREQAAVERFYSLLERAPRKGTSFDRVTPRSGTLWRRRT